jgi:hypothetical protein
MNVIGKTARAGFAWLTAITMLVAGLPHFQCQCPNGAIKPFCFVVVYSSSGCCCSDACSGAPKDSRCNPEAASSRTGRPACCCAHSRGRRTPQDSGGAPRLEGKGCQKTLAQQQQFAPAAATKSVNERCVAHAVCVASVAVTPCGPAGAMTNLGGLHLAAPPPPDLVVVLQRFLI